MRYTTFNLRGVDMDIAITNDGGYEPDTGAHDIDWHFTDANDNHDSIILTTEEEQAIYEHIASLDPEYFDDDVL